MSFVVAMRAMSGEVRNFAVMGSRLGSDALSRTPSARAFDVQGGGSKVKSKRQVVLGFPSLEGQLVYLQGVRGTRRDIRPGRDMFERRDDQVLTRVVLHRAR